MEQEQLTLYKLMILYLIEKVDFPLSNSQISEFILIRDIPIILLFRELFMS